jgi:hypothetical protein
VTEPFRIELAGAASALAVQVSEAPWIACTATVLAGARPSITVLVNGGQIAYSDVQHSIEAGRRVVVIAGSGGTADVFAEALAGAPADHRTAALISSGLIRVIPKDQPTLLAEVLTATLGEPVATRPQTPQVRHRRK